MGDAVRAEARRQHITPTGENLGRIMLELRERSGPGAIALLIRPLVETATSDTVIVDGIRSGHEIDVLRSCGRVKILAVHASADTRFVFLSQRKRSDDPDTTQELEARDRRELGVGISDPIALADESISNNRLNVNALVNAAIEVIRRWGG